MTIKPRPRINPLVLSQCRASIHQSFASPYILISDQLHPPHQTEITSNHTTMSPAAMFLSSFSAPSSPSLPPDSEGAVVGGYTLGPIIGHGAFSIIRRAFSTSGGTVAVKVVRRSDLARQADPTMARNRLDRESEVWGTLSHEHILPLFSITSTPHADYFFTLYCPAGTLFDILKRDGRPALPQDEAGMMFRQVVRGLRYLHEVALLVHRDIKPENVLVDDMGNCKIGDFGMSIRIDEFDSDSDYEQEVLQGDENEVEVETSLPPPSHSRRWATGAAAVVVSHLRPPADHHPRHHRNSAPPGSITTPSLSTSVQPGSLPYAAPELLLPGGRQRPHPAQDIWALGVLLYVLLTGKLPFSDPFEPRLQMKILLGDYVVPMGIGRGAEKVLQGCLERSVADRWTIDMVDDVAWGIGWGNEGDDIPSLIEEFVRSKRKRRSTRASLLGFDVLPVSPGTGTTRKPDEPIVVMIPPSPPPPPPLPSSSSSSQRSSWDNNMRRRRRRSSICSPVSGLGLGGETSFFSSVNVNRGRRTRSSSRSPQSLSTFPQTDGGCVVRERGRKATPEQRFHDDDDDDDQLLFGYGNQVLETANAAALSSSSKRQTTTATGCDSRSRCAKQLRVMQRAESVPPPKMKSGAEELVRSTQQQQPAVSRSRSGTRSRSVGCRYAADTTFLRLS